MNRSIVWTLTALLAVSVSWACGAAEPAPAEYPPVEGNAEASTEGSSSGTSGGAASGGAASGAATSGAEASAGGEPTSGSGASAPAAASGPAPKVVPARKGTLLGPEPKLIIRMPPDGKLYKSGDIVITLRLDNWEMQPEPGPHLMVVVDDLPAVHVRDVSKPLNINKLVKAQLGVTLAEGTHVVRLFPAYTSHEVVKEGKTFAMIRAHLGTRSADFDFNKEDPLMTVSQPGSCHRAGKPVLIDFHLNNVSDLGPKGTRVRYTVDGSVRGEIAVWAPHQIEGLAEGEHRVQLELIGPDGKALSGRFNNITRTFKVAASCP